MLERPREISRSKIKITRVSKRSLCLTVTVPISPRSLSTVPDALFAYPMSLFLERCLDPITINGLQFCCDSGYISSRHSRFRSGRQAGWGRNRRQTDRQTDVYWHIHRSPWLLHAKLSSSGRGRDLLRSWREPFKVWRRHLGHSRTIQQVVGAN